MIFPKQKNREAKASRFLVCFNDNGFPIYLCEDSRNRSLKRINDPLRNGIFQLLLVKKAYSVTYGARNLRREIQRSLEDPISEKIIDSFECPISAISISVENEEIVVTAQ